MHFGERIVISDHPVEKAIDVAMFGLGLTDERNIDSLYVVLRNALLSVDMCSIGPVEPVVYPLQSHLSILHIAFNQPS